MTCPSWNISEPTENKSYFLICILLNLSTFRCKVNFSFFGQVYSSISPSTNSCPQLYWLFLPTLFLLNRRRSPVIDPDSSGWPSISPFYSPLFKNVFYDEPTFLHTMDMSEPSKWSLLYRFFCIRMIFNFFLLIF